MMTMAEALRERLEASKNNKLAEHISMERKEYNKKWADAVEHFKVMINKEREGTDQLQLPWIAVQQKVIHIKEISDLRWFYNACIRYKKQGIAEKNPEKTFSRCFFGALKVK